MSNFFSLRQIDWIQRLKVRMSIAKECHFGVMIRLHVKRVSPLYCKKVEFDLMVENLPSLLTLAKLR